jgi:hypothetical protein
VTVALVLTALWGCKWYGETQLGRLVLTTDGPGLAAELFEADQDRPVVSPFPVPTLRPVTLPPGDYRLRLGVGQGRRATYGVYITAGQDHQFKVHLEETGRFRSVLFGKPAPIAWRLLEHVQLSGDGRLLCSSGRGSVEISRRNGSVLEHGPAVEEPLLQTLDGQTAGAHGWPESGANKQDRVRLSEWCDTNLDSRIVFCKSSQLHVMKVNDREVL